MMFNQLFWRFITVATSGVILYLSLTPSPAVAGTGWDKANHAAAMAVVTLLAIRAFLPYQQAIGLAAGYTLFLGVLIELLQGLCTINRFAEWGDIIADVVGIALAVTALMLWNRRKGKNEATC